MPPIKIPKADTMEIFRTTNFMDQDNEEFLALLLTAEQAEDTSLTRSTKLCLFQSIRPEFLNQLLSITSHDLMRQFHKFAATAVLATFCEDPNMAAYPYMIMHIPKLIKTVCQTDHSSRLANITKKNAYFCLYEMSQSEYGRMIFVECRAITQLSELFLGTSKNAKLALEVLRNLVLNINNCWDRTESVLFHKVMNKIAINLDSQSEQENLDTCMILKDFMFSNKTSDWFGHLWPQIIYKEINNTLNLKKKNAVALFLAPIVLNYFGIEWIMSSTDGNPKEFIFRLVNVSVMEIHMQLAKNPLNAILENDMNLIISCTMILETILIVTDLKKLKLQQLDLQPLNENFKKTAQQIIKFLMLMSARNFTQLNLTEYSCIDHFVRFLTGCLIKNSILQIDVVFPISLDVANKSFLAQRNAELKRKGRSRAEAAAIAELTCKELSSNILRKILPLLRILAGNKNAREILGKPQQISVFFECLKYYCAIILSESTLNDEKSSLLRQKKYARRAMVHICWILYHIKLQPGYCDPPACASIRHFILDNLPMLPRVEEDFELIGILSLIGLLLVQKIKMDNKIANLIKVSLNYLCEVSTDDEIIKSVHVHKIWSVKMCILPWFLFKSYMFSESSIVMTRTLEFLSLVTDESIRARIKCAYEEFFLHVANSNQNGIDEANKHCLLQISRDYRMEKLAKILNENKKFMS